MSFHVLLPYEGYLWTLFSIETHARIKRFEFLWMTNPLHAAGETIPLISNNLQADELYILRSRRNRISLSARRQQITFGLKPTGSATLPIRADLEQLALLYEQTDHGYDR